MKFSEAILKEIRNDGIVIQQELSSELLFLKYCAETMRGLCKVNDECTVEFEINSFLWKAKGVWLTNASLIWIVKN